MLGIVEWVSRLKLQKQVYQQCHLFQYDLLHGYLKCHGKGVMTDQMLHI